MEGRHWSQTQLFRQLGTMQCHSSSWKASIVVVSSHITSVSRRHKEDGTIRLRTGVVMSDPRSDPEFFGRQPMLSVSEEEHLEVGRGFCFGVPASCAMRTSLGIYMTGSLRGGIGGGKPGTCGLDQVGSSTSNVA